VAPSAGAAACTPCGAGFTSSPDSTSCDTCTPSAFDHAKFKCFSDLAKAGVIIGYISSLLSFLFSVYKARVFVRERVQRLQAAGVRPTLKRIVFVDRALANDPRHIMVSLSDMHMHIEPDESGAGSEDAVVQMVRGVQRQLQQLQEQMKQEKQQLLPLADRAGALGESGPGSNGAAVDTVRDLQRQVAQLQEQQQHQLQQQQQSQEMQQLMQQQQQELRLEMQQLMQQQRQEILQLTQQLQRLQQ
jgi:hypothetical protein